MPISFNCPACGKKTKAPDEMAGKKARCPICKEVIEVPEPAYEFEEAPPAPKKPAPKEENDEDEGRKPCPMCGEMIREEAVKCRYCGEVFDPELRKRQKKRQGGGNADDDMSTGDYVAAFLCSGIGCIAGIIWMIQGKRKGLKMFLISLIMSVVWSILRIALESAAKGR